MKVFTEIMLAQEPTKYLKITECHDPLMWYRDKVGQCVPYVRTDNDCHWSRESAGYLNIVKLTDAKIVECCDKNCNQGRACPLKV